jgi:methionyl-tRNA formyltransferase
MFARVPGWYSFRRDRLARRFEAEGHEVVGIVVQKTATLASLREWMHKLGFRVIVRKVIERLVTGSPGERRDMDDAPRVVNYPPCKAEVYRIASHNSYECLKIVAELRPDIVMLRGCLIIDKNVLQIPTFGTINPHYALLPAYRGMEVTEWSVLHGDPCGVSVHWVTEAVDAGEVIVSQRIDVKPGDTLGKLREKCAALSVDLLIKALRRIESDKLCAKVSAESGGRQYFVMHPRLYQLAGRRLSLVGGPESEKKTA